MRLNPGVAGPAGQDLDLRKDIGLAAGELGLALGLGGLAQALALLPVAGLVGGGDLALIVGLHGLKQVGADARGGDLGLLQGVGMQPLVADPTEKAPFAEADQADEHGGQQQAEPALAAGLRAGTQGLEVVLQPPHGRPPARRRCLVAQVVVGAATQVVALQGAALGLMGGGVGVRGLAVAGAGQVERLGRGVAQALGADLDDPGALAGARAVQ